MLNVSNSSLQNGWHPHKFKRMRREIKRLKTFLGRAFRNICRKIAGNAGLESRFARLLGLVERL